MRRRSPPLQLCGLPWRCCRGGDVWEDFLDGIGVSLGEFSSRMTGGWLFGYIDALKLQIPSRREGVPVAPLEAMACSLPVVAASALGVSDILGDGDTEACGGVVVPIGDPMPLAAALGRLLDDEILSRKLGMRARARVEAAFAPQKVGSQLASMLRS